ncbi:hypothetical protein COOONC_03240 [Cooperia oncophora]
MLRYQKVPLPLRFLRHQHHRLAREEHGRSSNLLYDLHYEEHFPAEEPNHWFLNQRPVGNMSLNSIPQQAIRELRSFDDFGVLSADVMRSSPEQTFYNATTFMDELMSYEMPSVTSADAIPTSADPSELGGSSESSDMEQLEELIDQGYDVSAVLRDMCAAPGETCAVASDMAAKPVKERKQNDSGTQSDLLLQRAIDTRSAHHEDSVPSSSEHSKTHRFDPEIHREMRASPAEIIDAVHSQDLALLRSILTERKWPDHRSIGAYLDQLFELVIRDSYDTDEAVMFLQDFAVCNRRGFLHDVNGVRLALRVARDSGSVEAASEMLRVFRNMFLVKSPVPSKSATSSSVLDEFYSALCSIGPPDQVEAVHKLMNSLGFDKNSESFLRCVTKALVEKGDVRRAFDEWQRLSMRYGTTGGSELLWQGIFEAVDNRAEQARLAGKLLRHCCQQDHPFAVISSLVMALVHLKHLDTARAVLIKVAVPGRFFKKPLACVTRCEDSLEVIENFAGLVTQCMFSEKRKIKEVKESSGSASILSPELSSVLDSFYGKGRPKQQSSNRDDSKRKLHRVNDEQLFELSQFVQSLWLEKAG